jgi:type IV pilus assembly protein PilV
MINKKLNNRKNGFFIMEALISILIFIIGVLGILQLQVSQMQATADAQYRSQASYMADNLMTQIIIDKENIDTFVDKTNPEYMDWENNLRNVLPGVNDNPPEITTSIATTGGILVKIVVKWKAPQNELASQYELKSIII